MKDYSKYELFVRKKVSSIIEKLLRYLGYDFVHDRYKAIVYSETPYITKQEEYMKSLYDGFMFLLNNKSSTINKSLVKKYFYIIGIEGNETKINDLLNYYYASNDKNPILKAIDFSAYFYNLFKEIKDVLVLSVMIFNYILVKNEIPCTQIVRRYIPLFDNYINDYEATPDNLINLIYQIISEAKYMEKSYYENLKFISDADVITGILEEKEYLQENNIQSVILFGSFAKKHYRIDSDIDILVKFNEDLSYQNKIPIIEKVKLHLTKKFNRFVDIAQIGSFFNENLILELIEYKKIF